jgi:hypothetical protein
MLIARNRPTGESGNSRLIAAGVWLPIKIIIVIATCNVNFSLYNSETTRDSRKLLMERGEWALN